MKSNIGFSGENRCYQGKKKLWRDRVENHAQHTSTSHDAESEIRSQLSFNAGKNDNSYLAGGAWQANTENVTLPKMLPPNATAKKKIIDVNIISVHKCFAGFWCVCRWEVNLSVRENEKESSTFLQLLATDFLYTQNSVCVRMCVRVCMCVSVSFYLFFCKAKAGFWKWKAFEAFIQL